MRERKIGREEKEMERQNAGRIMDVSEAGLNLWGQG